MTGLKRHSTSDLTEWASNDFPEPNCPDPTHYALALSTIEQSVDVFDWHIQLGMNLAKNASHLRNVHADLVARIGKRRDVEYPPPALECVPHWTQHVPPAPVPLLIMSSCPKEGLSFPEVLKKDKTRVPNPHFLKRSFIVDMNFLQFV